MSNQDEIMNRKFKEVALKAQNEFFSVLKKMKSDKEIQKTLRVLFRSKELHDRESYWIKSIELGNECLEGIVDKDQIFLPYHTLRGGEFVKFQIEDILNWVYRSGNEYFGDFQIEM